MPKFKNINSNGPSSKIPTNFFEYRPIHKLVWKNKNKINWILDQDFYLNWWKKNYTITNEYEWEQWELLIDNKNNLLGDYAVLSYFLLSNNNYFIKDIQNKTNIPWLWVILINELKKKLKNWGSIELLDCAYNKNWDKMKWYYQKQWFREGFFKTIYTTNKKEKSIFKLIKNYLKL